MRIVSVVGARPNFMKLAPVDRELAKRGDVEHVIVHTGQHYDPGMSDAFFEELWIPAPDRDLGVGSGSHAQQPAAVMQRLEPVVVELRPDLVLVYGDVNSTVAAALVAAKLQVRVGHVEAGLRSRDWTMPEEINRVVTDSISNLLFTPSRDANANLIQEGIPAAHIHFVGNVMIDSLVAVLDKAAVRGTYERLGMQPSAYGLVTLHRPSNVDDPEMCLRIVEALAKFHHMPLVFPIHPRTRKSIEAFGLSDTLTDARHLVLLDPLGYLDFLNLEMHARFVVTDSGGVQEETSWLG